MLSGFRMYASNMTKSTGLKSHIHIQNRPFYSQYTHNSNLGTPPNFNPSPPPNNEDVVFFVGIVCYLIYKVVNK